MNKQANRYVALIERIFRDHYQTGMTEFDFERDELSKTAKSLHIALPKNLGDIVYSFRYRVSLPKSITETAAKGDGLDNQRCWDGTIPFRAGKTLPHHA